MEVKRKTKSLMNRVGKSTGQSRRQAQSKKKILSLYAAKPSGEVTLGQFEEVATQRLHVLKAIDKLTTKSLPPDVLRDQIMEAERKQGLRSFDEDQISHFILRLAFCRTEELRRWFINQEVRLFRARFEYEPASVIDTFCKENNLVYEPVKDFTPSIRRNMTLMGDPPNTTYYRVPFEEALELVQRRQCFLHQGEAYIARTHLVSIVALKFRIYLSHQMAATLRSSTHVRKDKRVTPLLNMLAQQHVGPTFKTGFGSNVVSVKEIPGLSERSFPLCMHVPNKELHKNAHLRHGGRMQLGLFLKGIGLSLEEALTYWQKAFSRKTDASKFQKQYAYNIRHNYGQEGKRASYTPYSCMKIINGAPGQGEHHGCPFRHYDVNNLKMKLRERRVPANQIKEITDLVKGSHFQIACTRYFSATHNNTEPEEPINHPNSYFNSSMKFHKAAAELANPGDANSSNSNSITSLPAAQNSSSSSFDVKKSVP